MGTTDQYTISCTSPRFKFEHFCLSPRQSLKVLAGDGRGKDLSGRTRQAIQDTVAVGRVELGGKIIDQQYTTALRLPPEQRCLSQHQAATSIFCSPAERRSLAL